nr:hypothetical protein [Synergistaceae bacterium]
MSSVLSHQRVLRAVRLLPEAVKIGVSSEPEEPEKLEAEAEAESEAEPEIKAEVKAQEDKNQELNKKLERERAEALRKSDERLSPLLNKQNKELTQKVRELQDNLDRLEIEKLGIEEAKNKLESEINNVKADYENKKREVEANADAMAKQAADEARAKGHDEGFNSGHAEGLAAARKEVEQEYLNKFSGLMQILNNINKKLDENFAELVSLNQPRMIRVWSEMLKRMLARQVELHPETVEVVLSDVLTRLSDKSQVVIYVSPDDAARLEGNLDAKFQEVLRGVHKLEVKSDPNVETGSCLVETNLGVYDARWRTQVGQIESVIDNIFTQINKNDD